MKYDFDLKLDQNDAVGMLLKYIRPHSKVLEFGCANGRMTKYMHEVLACDVYIVEYDEAAFQDAVVYAKAGICDDIMKFQWEERFSGVAFDVIVFADVLEHLSDPDKVLMRAAAMLVSDGMMLVSLPNIAHNDVIYGLLNDRFHYTNVGLLDTSHVHFFAYQELAGFFEKAGLAIVEEEGSVLAKQRTELNQDGAVWNAYDRLLQGRSLGNVYQFVIKAMHKEYVEAHGVEKHSSLMGADCYAIGKIYFDTGAGFHEEARSIFRITQKHAHLYQYIRLPAGTKRIRIDPVEEAYCFLSGLKIWSDAGAVKVVEYNGVQMGDAYLFSTTDPWLTASVEGAVEWIKFSAEMNVLQDSSEEEFFTRIRQNQEALEGKVEAAHTRLADKDAELASALQQFQEQNQLLEQQKIEVTQQAEQFKAQKLYFEHQLDLEQQKVAQMHEQNAALDQQRAEAQNQAAQLMELRVELEKKLSAEQQKVLLMQEHSAAVTQQLAEAEETIKELHIKNQQLEELLVLEKQHENESNLEAQQQSDHYEQRISVLEQEKNSLCIEIGNLSCHIANLDAHKNALEQRIAEDEQVLQQQLQQNDMLRHQYDTLSAENRMLLQSEKTARLNYEAIANSDYWKLTAPARAVTVRLRSMLGFNRPEGQRSAAIRGLFYLKRNGFGRTVRRAMQEFRRPQGAAKPAALATPSNAMPKLPFIYSNDGNDTKKIDALVSVVIPAKNGGDDFDRLMKILRRQQGFREIEIVVVDSGSTDATLTIARRHKANIIRIKPEEFSHSYARNLGVKAAKGDYVLVMTQDAMPTSDYWMYNLYLALTHAPDIGAVSCAEYARADSDMYHRVFAWNHYRYLGADEKNIIMKKPDSSDMQEIRRNAQLSDITCMMPRAIAEKYPYQGSFAEDLDLGMRLINDGYRLGFLGTEVAIHSHNRGAYYYLRRRFVEFVTLKEIFPEQEIIPYRFDQVAKEAAFVFCQLARIFMDMSNDQIISLKQFQDDFRSALYATRSMTFPEKLLWTPALDGFVDSTMESVMRQLIDQYNAAGYLPNEPYAGSLIDGIDGYIGICYLYMDTCFEQVNADIICDFKDCLGKILASAMGTFFAYSYYTDVQDRENHREFFQKIGAGV